jgi:hypothetical protein
LNEKSILNFSAPFGRVYNVSHNSTLHMYIKMLDFYWIKGMLFFRKYYDFLQFFLRHGIFFPAITSAVVFFRNTTAGGKIPCLKIDRDLKIVVFYILMLSGFILR